MEVNISALLPNVRFPLTKTFRCNMTRHYLFIGLLTTSLSLLGCGRGGNNPADGSSGDTGGQSSSFTLDGRTYTTTSTAPLQNNVQQTIDGRTVTLNNFVADAFGVFIVRDNATACSITGNSNNAAISLGIAFPGRQTGSTNQGIVALSVGTTLLFSTSAQVNVTEYGNPGGRIRGTFSFRNFDQTISGSFAVTRSSDAP